MSIFSINFYYFFIVIIPYFLLLFITLFYYLYMWYQSVEDLSQIYKLNQIMLCFAQINIAFRFFKNVLNNF